MSFNLATFAGGCFWGIENYFKKQFGSALLSTQVGYTGGQTDQVDYQSVCSGRTGHAEAVQFKFNPDEVSYKELTTYFFRIHDPTTLNRQGNDAGTQYRSAIFYHTEEQKTIAEQVKEEVRSKFKNPIITEISPFTKWFKAEPIHQNYLEKNPGGYCNHSLKW